MLTNKDIQKIIEVVATKEDVDEIKENLTSLTGSVRSLTNSVDKLAKAVEDLSQEYAAITAKIDRHEKWIQQIAGKLRLRLPY